MYSTGALVKVSQTHHEKFNYSDFSTCTELKETGVCFKDPSPIRTGDSADVLTAHQTRKLIHLQ